MAFMVAYVAATLEGSDNLCSCFRDVEPREVLCCSRKPTWQFCDLPNSQSNCFGWRKSQNLKALTLRRLVPHDRFGRIRRSEDPIDTVT
jgi:hypothetical protein